MTIKEIIEYNYCKVNTMYKLNSYFGDETNGPYHQNMNQN